MMSKDKLNLGFLKMHVREYMNHVRQQMDVVRDRLFFFLAQRTYPVVCF